MRKKIIDNKSTKKSKKNRGIKSVEETPPIVYPTFENSGSIITDNEYEVNSENIEIEKEEIKSN